MTKSLKTKTSNTNFEANSSTHRELKINDRPIDTETNEPVTSLHRYRFLIWIYELLEVEMFNEVKQAASTNSAFYIQYQLLNQLVKYKVNFSHCVRFGVDYVPINRMKMLYFFDHEEVGFDNFYKAVSPIRVSIIHENIEIAYIDLQLKEVSVIIKYHNFIEMKPKNAQFHDNQREL